MIANAARAWAAGIARMPRAAVRAGVGRAGDPARVADDDGAAVAVRRPPTGPPRRDHAGVVAVTTPRTAGRPPPREHRVARERQQQAGEQRRPRHDRVDLQVLGRARGRCRRSGPGRRASARPCPTVVFASEAPPVAASASSKPSSSATRLGVLHEAAAPRRASPSAASRPSISSSVGHVRAPSVARDQLADRRLGRVEVVARSSPAGRPRARSARRRRSGRVPPRMTPTLTVTPGQRPLSACRSRTIRPPRGSRCGPSRARRPRGPRGRGPSTRRRRCPCAPTRCRRWRGRTRGPGTRRRPRRCRGCAASRSASRSPRPGWRRTSSRSNGRPSAAPAASALRRVEPGRAGPHFMSVTPGPVGDPVVDRGTGAPAAVPGSNTVSMWPMSRTRGPPRSALERRRRPCRRGGPPGPATLDVGAELARGTRRPTRRPRRRPPACS